MFLLPQHLYYFCISLNRVFLKSYINRENKCIFHENSCLFIFKSFKDFSATGLHPLPRLEVYVEVRSPPSPHRRAAVAVTQYHGGVQRDCSSDTRQSSNTSERRMQSWSLWRVSNSLDTLPLSVLWLLRCSIMVRYAVYVCLCVFLLQG